MAIIQKDCRHVRLGRNLSLHHVKTWRGSKAAICEAGRRLSPDTTSDSILILDFQLPEMREIHFCALSLPVCGILLWQLELTTTLPFPSLLSDSSLPNGMF